MGSFQPTRGLQSLDLKNILTHIADVLLNVNIDVYVIRSPNVRMRCTMV